MLRRKWTTLLNRASKVIFLLLISLLLVSCGLPKETESEAESGAAREVEPLQVIFIDVGQGDATLVISGEHAMLIDTGDNTKGEEIQLYMLEHGVEKLDYLVLTHTDADHIGGADIIINEFEIENVLLSDVQRDYWFYQEVKEALDEKELTFVTPSVGEEFVFADAKFTILAPNREYEDINNSSIALLLEHGDNRFMFTGDAKEEAESDILTNGIDLDCDVYKAGHHGSYTSSNRPLLEAMTPEYAVISCGKDNDYGYPHREVLNDFRSMGIQVYRTDEQGTVIATSDGNNIVWEMMSSEMSEMQARGIYAVNRKNGKIHKVGACEATGSKEGAMTTAAYFETYEEAEAYSLKIFPKQERRKCGECW